MIKDIPLEFSGEVKKVMVGLSWDPNETPDRMTGDVKVHNVDLSCALFDQDMKVFEILTPQNTKVEQYKNSIFHYGDNLSGGSDYEDEQILVNLSHLDEKIHALAFIVSTNDRVKIHQVANGNVSFLNTENLKPFLSIDFSEFTLLEDVGGAPMQEHHFAGMMRKSTNDDWCVKDIQFSLKSLVAEEIEEVVKMVVR